MNPKLTVVQLIAAIRKSDVSTVQQYFRDNPTAIDDHTYMSGQTAVAFAAWEGALDVVRTLVEMGADINKGAANHGTNALEAAASRGHAAVVQYLTTVGARLETEDAVRNPLFSAIAARSTDVARILVDAGMDLHPRYVLGAPSNPSLDALAFAVLHGQSEIAHHIALKIARGDEGQAQAALRRANELAIATTTPANQD